MMRKSQLTSIWIVAILWVITIFVWYNGDSYSWGFTQFLQATIFWGIFGFLLVITFSQKRNNPSFSSKISSQKNENSFSSETAEAETKDLNCSKGPIVSRKDIQPKDLNKFDGWLVWFYFTIWISFIAMIGFEVYYLFMDTHIFLKMLLLVDYGILIFLIYKIIKIIRGKDATVPDVVVQLMFLVVLLNVVFSIFEIFTFVMLAGLNQSSETIVEYGKNIFKAAVSCLIWMSYFQKSKRVCAYYGKNAGRALINMGMIRDLFRK